MTASVVSTGVSFEPQAVKLKDKTAADKYINLLTLISLPSEHNFSAYV